MNDLEINPVKSEVSSDHIVRFVVAGLIAMVLIVVTLSVGTYYLIRKQSLQLAKTRYIELVEESYKLNQAHRPQKTNGSLVVATPQLLGRRILSIPGIKGVTLLDDDKTELWSSKGASVIASDENYRSAPFIVDASFLDVDSWLSVLANEPLDVLAVVPLVAKRKRADGYVVLNLKLALLQSQTRKIGILMVPIFTIASLCLFLFLLSNFKRTLRIIDEQESELEHQITRLSNMLAINKSMQKSIKTASARAVELNEQFLRRLGADLHDGPAQMIGFAVLRLNKVSKQEEAKKLGHEFHAVKEALDESLEEIRGISSGLVLPELAEMTLEECIRKVITLHSAKSKAEVAQFYSEIPGDIPLPIKICAYRFVQEGLNNAHNHGRAKKCKVSVHVKDETLEVTLKDNGMGFRMSAVSKDSGRLGLLGLKDRVESLGGKFNINSELGVGTALKFWVSIQD